jgi:hypothetical protein
MHYIRQERENQPFPVVIHHIFLSKGNEDEKMCMTVIIRKIGKKGQNWKRSKGVDGL